MAKQRLIVTKESNTGMNQEFHDTKTGENMTRTEVARTIDAGKYPAYHHFRNHEGELIIRSNPNGKSDDNLG